MATDIYIYAGNLQSLERQEGDVTAIPAGASLIVALPEWATMCSEAGGEAALIVALGVVDRREEGPRG